MTTKHNPTAQSPHPKETSMRPLPPPGRRPRRHVIILLVWLLVLIGGGAAGAMVPLPDLRMDGNYMVYSSVIMGDGPSVMSQSVKAEIGSAKSADSERAPAVTAVVQSSPTTRTTKVVDELSIALIAPAAIEVLIATAQYPTGDQCSADL